MAKLPRVPSFLTVDCGPPSKECINKGLLKKDIEDFSDLGNGRLRMRLGEIRVNMGLPGILIYRVHVHG